MRELDDLSARLTDERVGEDTILAPYQYPDQGSAGRLPTAVVLAAWHHLQRCDTLDRQAIDFFLRHFRSPTLDDKAYLGDAPEPGIPI